MNGRRYERQPLCMPAVAATNFSPSSVVELASTAARMETLSLML